MELVFGALAPDLKTQLRGQGLRLSLIDLKRLEAIKTAVILLRIHGLLTDSETARAHMKLMKQITQAVKPLTGKAAK